MGIKDFTTNYVSPSKAMLNEKLTAVCKVLLQEITTYRQENSDKKPGGFLEFLDDLPIVIVPDLHARFDFFTKIFTYKLIDNLTIEELLQQKRIRVICVGDGLHSEKRGKERWLKAYEEFQKGKYTNKYISQEMSEGLSLMCSVMDYKIKYPENFHFLKGNHENILNEDNHGNCPFLKYAFEGEMVFDYMIKKYGITITELYSEFELLLPVFVKGKNYLISHAEPLENYSKEQLVNSFLQDKVIYGLTWTTNHQEQLDTAQKMLENFCPNNDKALYFAGHRPVQNKYELRENNRFVQIHNPEKMQIIYVNPNEDFDFENNFLDVEKQ